MSKKKNKGHHTYWSFDDADVVLQNTKSLSPSNDFEKIVQLAAKLRANKNFVQIITNRSDINVTYSTAKYENSTDGNNITLSTALARNSFDATVGLCLHESAHILLTDFSISKYINALKPSQYDISLKTTPAKELLSPELNNLLMDRYCDYTNIGSEITPVVLHVIERYHLLNIFTICNVLEDRRIDKYMYLSAPGYRPYYDALYKKYFFTKAISNNLKYNPSWKIPTIENYINHIISIINPNIDLDALPDLRVIHDMIDIKNIDRLNISSDDIKSKLYPQEYKSFTVTLSQCPLVWQEAVKIYEVVIKNSKLSDNELDTLNTYLQLFGFNTNNNSTTNTSPNATNTYADESKSITNGDDANGNKPNTVTGVGQGNEQNSHVTDSNEGLSSDVDETNQNTPHLSPSDLVKGSRSIEVAKHIVNGTFNKGKISKKLLSKVQSLVESQVKILDISDRTKSIAKNIKCIVIEDIKESILKSSLFPFLQRNTREYTNIVEKCTSEGTRIGKLLEKRLQIRNELFLEKSSHLKQGKLEKRLIHQLGLGSEKIFSSIRHVQYKPVTLYVSLDASGSMSGSKWLNSLKLITALAYVSTKSPNIDCVIAIRGGEFIPVLAVIFDSKKHNFVQFKNILTKIVPSGSTPEGLTHEAMLKLMQRRTDNDNMYFINISDGEPQFSYSYNGTEFYYYGVFAFNQTRAIMNELRRNGVHVLSYFVSSSLGYISNQQKNTILQSFTQMYGKDAEFIDVTDVTSIAKTINKLLLSK